MANRRIARLRELGWTGKAVAPAPAAPVETPAASAAPVETPADTPAAPVETPATAETKEAKEARRTARILELDREAETARRAVAVKALGLSEALAPDPLAAAPPLPPVASYTHCTSFFELLEETPSSHPFHAALAEFIRAPDNLRPAALRALWDNASTHALTRSSQNEEDIAAFIAGRKVGLEEGYMAGLNEVPELHRQLEALEATKKREFEAGCQEVRETCQSGTCVGASRERIRWSEHRASGPCRSGRPATVNMAIQVAEVTTADIAVQVAPSSDSTPPSSPISVQPPPHLPVPARPTVRAASFDLPPPSLDHAPRSSWDDEVSDIPLIPMFPSPPRRDISVLCSGAKHPFGSLQRRSRRLTRTENTPWRRYIPPPPVPHAPAPNYATKPTYPMPPPPVPPQPISSTPPISVLHDPHQLLKLVQVLQILGWSPPT